MKQLINKIYLFGDSFVEGQGTYEKIVNGCVREVDLPFDLLGEWRKENSWNKFIKKYFPSANIINCASQGSDNYYQFSELNKIIQTLNEDELVLFGFTSKYRDTPHALRYAYHLDDLLHNDNPLLQNFSSWEKVSQLNERSGTYYDSEEGLISDNFLKSFYSSVFDESFFENIAQVNYLFYQEYITQKNLNIHFFDLFEPYVDSRFVRKQYNVNKNIYLTYLEDDLHTFLCKYEKKHGPHSDMVSYWEDKEYKPCDKNKIFHPNQHGYEVWINYMCERWLLNWYE